MPFRDLPPWTRRCLRALLGGAYLMVAHAGLSGLVWTPQIIEGAAGIHLTRAWALGAITSAGVAFVGVAWDRYRLEWAAVWWVAASLSIYTTTVWYLVGETPARQAQASALTALCLVLTYRGVELAGHAAKLRREHRRQVR